MIIEWKGKVGYGDIVSPLCYAINQSEIRNEKVHLKFIWNKQNEDPESLLNRVDFLFDKIAYKNLEIYHSFDDTFKLDHTNYEIKALKKQAEYHNVYFPKWNVEPKYTVVCSPLFNKTPLKDYGYKKEWKDGLTFEQWDDLIYVRRYNNIHVDYRTPIKDLFEIFSQCKYFIGYHGSCSWVARLFKIPMTIYSHDKKFTRWAFPWQADTEEESRILLENAENKRNEYIERIRGS